MRSSILIMMTAFLSISLLSCLTTGKLPPKPEYGTRADYPNLVEITTELQFSRMVNLMEVDQKSVHKMGDRIVEISRELNCGQWGVVKVNVVVTKEAKVDAPIIISPLNSNCDKAALIAIRYLKYKKPARINGEAVNTTKVVSFFLNNSILSR